MSDNPLIEGFLKLHEAGGIGGGMSGTKFSNAANYAPPVGAGVRGAFNDFTMDKGKYARAAVDYIAKNSGFLAGVPEPTTFDKELEQENEKDIAAQNNFPLAYKGGKIGSKFAQVTSGVGLLKAGIKAGINATTKNTGQTIDKIAKNADAGDFQLGSLNLTPQMRVPKPLNLTPQMRVPKLRTEEENDSSKGNNEMSTNPFIKGFLKLQERFTPRPGTGDAASNTVTDRTGNSSPSTAPYNRPPNTLAMNPRGAGTGYSMNTGVPVRIEGPTENKPKVSNLSSSSANLKVSPDRDRRASPIAPVGTKTSNLRVGSSGDEVKRAQEALGITADGSYGPQTRQAVIDFQKKNNLKADGIIGDQTLSAMNRQKDLGESEMSTNPYIKGFFDIEEARAKNTNIFDESKKLTAAAAAAEYDGEYGDKRKIVIPKNRQGEITQFTGLHTVKTQKPYKKEVDFDDADYTHRVGGYYNDKPVSLNVRAKSKEEAQRIASEQFKNFRPTIVKQLTNEGLDENAFNQLGQKKPVGDILPAPAKGVVPKHGKKFKEGDIVVPHAGPHAGVKHKVVFARKGSVNMIPLGISAKEDKYDSATVRANHEHLSPYIAEEADLDEAKKAKPGHNASVMANKAAILTKFLKKKNEDEDEKIDEANILPSNFSDRTTPLPDKILYAIDKENSKKKKPVSLKKAPFDMKKEEVEFSEEEIDFINNVMEAMPVAPTSENDSPNPTPKRNAEGSRAKGSMAD